MSVNKVILVGNVGNDPEIKYLDQDVKLARFNMATSETYIAKNGERVTTTEWHRIVIWRGLADVVEKYVTKGKQLYIEGKIRTRAWDDKDGIKRYTTEIVADTMQMLGSRADSQNQSPNEQEPKNETSTFTAPDFNEPEDDGDLPF